MDKPNQATAPVASRWRKLGCAFLVIAVAIVLSLAAEMIPNIMAILEDNRARHARADIAGIESASVKLLADSGQNTLGALLDQTAIRAALHLPETGPPNSEQFQRLAEVYSNAYIALLIHGRFVLERTEHEPITGLPYPKLFSEAVVRRLAGPKDQYETPNGVPYDKLMNKALVKPSAAYFGVPLDPWGQRYNIYPGPWRAEYGPIVFRVYRQAPKKVNPHWIEPDALTVNKDREGKEFVDQYDRETYVIGLPAKGDNVAYIWSQGGNLTSDQALLVAAGADNEPLKHYDLVNKADLDAGGGDDINNWDNGSSWQEFYSRHRQ